jgi:hypothetical protein
MSINTALLALKDCIAVEHPFLCEARHASFAAFLDVIAEVERIEKAKPHINDAVIYFHDGHLDRAEAAIDVALGKLGPIAAKDCALLELEAPVDKEHF